MKTILIIEDDLFLDKLLKRKLEKRKYHVYYLENGIEAVSAARHYKPDLILLDLVMPQKNGFETLKDLKADPQTKSIPVLVLTALEVESDIQTAISLGATKYLKKSQLSFDDVVAVIDQYKK